MINISVTAASVRISEEQVILLHSGAISLCPAVRFMLPLKISSVTVSADLLNVGANQCSLLTTSTLWCNALRIFLCSLPFYGYSW